MASKEECDRYAAEVTRRFEEFTQWSIAHWPNKSAPLQQSDFGAARKELAAILGEQLSAPSADSPSEGGPQYVNMNPTPWP